MKQIRSTRYALIVVIALLVACAAVVAQNTETLRKKYGSPIQASYQLNVNVSMRVTFTEDGEACELLIVGSDTRFSAQRIIDEIIPPSERGPVIASKGWELGNCLNYASLSYEKVDIYFDDDACGLYRRLDQGRALRGHIVWKNRKCKVDAITPQPNKRLERTRQ